MELEMKFTKALQQDFLRNWRRIPHTGIIEEITENSALPKDFQNKMPKKC